MRGPTAKTGARASAGARPKPKSSGRPPPPPPPAPGPPPVKTGGLVHAVWERPVFAARLQLRALEKRLRRDQRAIARLNDKLDWPTRLALLGFAASALGLAHAYVYFATLGLNIVEYASLADYPIFAIEGLWWAAAIPLFAAMAYAAPALAFAFFETRGSKMMKARWWRRRGRLTAEECQAELGAQRKPGWLRRIEGAVSSTYAAIIVLYVVLVSAVAPMLVPLAEAERVKALRPDSQLWRIAPTGLFYRDHVCVRTADGNYVNLLGQPPTATCQASAFPLGSTSAWLIFKFADGVKVLKRDDIRAVESVPPALAARLRAVDACRRAAEAAKTPRPCP